MKKTRRKKNKQGVRLAFLAVLSFALISIYFISSGQVRVVTVKSDAYVNSTESSFQKLELTSEVNTVTDLKQISKTPKNIVFFSASWCGMCNATKITLENELAKYEESQHLTLMEAKIENNRTIANEYEISYAPSLLINQEDGVTVIEDVKIQDIPQIIASLFE